MKDALWFVVGSRSDLLLQPPWEGIASAGCGASGTGVKSHMNTENSKIAMEEMQSSYLNISELSS